MKTKCQLHGEVDYLFSKTANAKICAKCVTAGYFSYAVTIEMLEAYPTRFIDQRVAELTKGIP